MELVASAAIAVATVLICAYIDKRRLHNGPPTAPETRDSQYTERSARFASSAHR